MMTMVVGSPRFKAQEKGQGVNKKSNFKTIYHIEYVFKANIKTSPL